MYKWHVQTAIGHHRPLANDFSRAAEGITLSLRQFHVSASQLEDREPGPRISRTQRSAAAAAEISSLNSGPGRPIDARALAAQPPVGFTIRRLSLRDDRGGLDSIRSRGSFGERGAGDGRVMRSLRVGFRGRGGPGQGRGRGRGRGRGMRGRGRGGFGKKRLSKPVEEVEKELLWTKEEEEYVGGVDMGISRPYQPSGTTLENLELDIPSLATISAPLGLVSAVKDRMRVLTGRTWSSVETSRAHTLEYTQGRGTLFVDELEKMNVEGVNREKLSLKKYETLTEPQREVILKNLVAGHYQKTEPPRKEDLMSVLQAYGQRNETYLPSDTKALKDKVQTLVPAKKAAAPQKQAVRK